MMDKKSMEEQAKSLLSNSLDKGLEVI